MTKTDKRDAAPETETPETEARETEARETEPAGQDPPEPAAKEPDEPGTASEAPDEPDEPERRRLSGDPLIRVASVVTLIALVAAAWSGWSYRSAAGDESLAFAADRDRVLAAADQAIVNLNTLDHRDVDAGLKVWQDSATAELYDEIVQGAGRLKSDIEKAETTSSAKVVESGLTELDTRAGKAAVIAAVQITVTRAGGEPATNLRRLTGQLTRTSAGWKLSALGQAPAGTP